MKRPLGNNPSQELRPSKIPHTMEPSNFTNNPFDAENEISVQSVHNVLNDGQPYTSSDKYINGVVNMIWASAPGGIQRFLLAGIEIKFTGCKENLPGIGNLVKVSMMGAILGASKNASLKIQCIGGILMQETKKTGEVIETDLFPKDDWFGTPIGVTAAGPPKDSDAPSQPTEPPKPAHEVEMNLLPTPNLSSSLAAKAAEPTHSARENQRTAGGSDSLRNLNSVPDEQASLQPAGQENFQFGIMDMKPTSLDGQHHKEKVAESEQLSSKIATDTASRRSKPLSLAHTATALTKPGFKPPLTVALVTETLPDTNAPRTLPARSESRNDVLRATHTFTRSTKEISMDSDLGERDGQRNPTKQQRQDECLVRPQPQPPNAIAGPLDKSTRRGSIEIGHPRAFPTNEPKGKRKKKKKRHDHRKSEPQPEAAVTEPPVKADVDRLTKEKSKMARKKQTVKEYLDMKAGYDCPQAQPGHYHPLNKLKDKAKVCFAGIAVEIGEIRTTASGDLQILVSLVDPSWRETRNVFTVQCFASRGQSILLPAPQLGQPLLLRLVKIQEFNGRPSGIAYKGDYTWACYNPTGAGQVTYNQKEGLEEQPPNAWTPTEADLRYLRDLSRWWAASEAKLTPDIRALIDMKPKAAGRISIGGPVDPSVTALTQIGGSLAPSRSHRKRGMCFIRDVEPGDFFDCVAQVTDFGMDQGLFSIMYATDYTRHRDMFAGSADRALRISLWNDDRVAALGLTPNFYHLRNILVKIDKEGKLEGQMRSTSGSSFKLLPRVNQEVQALLQRKAEVNNDQEYNDWPSLDTGVRPSAVDAQPIKEPVIPRDDGVPIFYPSTHALVHNRWTRAEFIPLSKLRLRADEPRTFRIAIRVMEYQPSNLREWIYAFCTTCRKGLPVEHQRCLRCGDELGDGLELSYRFVLRVRDDQGDEIDIFAAGQEAVDFLGAFPPKYLDTTHDLQTFTDYVMPILCKRDQDNDEVPGPFIDICVQGRIVDGYPIYNLYGAELDVAVK